MPIECVARGYLAGSGWKEYQKSQNRMRHSAAGRACGNATSFPSRFSRRPPRKNPGTTSTSALRRRPSGSASDGGRSCAKRTLSLYTQAADYAAARGVIIADTKFEFGRLPDGKMILIDEVLTPDSSRFWPADQYAPGRDQASFDKQFVRNYLERLDWDKTPPAPALPEDVVEGTRGTICGGV